MPSIFRSRNAAVASASSTAAPKCQKQKQKAGEARQTADAFRDDPELQQLHAETAELLRLVKSPTPTQARGTSSGGGCVSPSVNRRRRVTIEVLDVADEEDDGSVDGEAKAKRSSRPTESGATTDLAVVTGSDANGGDTANSDPFDFAAEEARVRKAADTFYPDLSPTKRGLTGQRDVFEKEQARLEALARREEETQARRRAALTEGFTAANRLEINAVKVSCVLHSPLLI